MQDYVSKQGQNGLYFSYMQLHRNSLGLFPGDSGVLVCEAVFLERRQGTKAARDKERKEVPSW